MVPFFSLVTEVQKSPFLHVSHLVSELQGQNSGEVVAFCFLWCFEERCILRPFSFFKIMPHSGHWFDLGWLGLLSWS